MNIHDPRFETALSRAATLAIGHAESLRFDGSLPRLRNGHHGHALLRYWVDHLFRQVMPYPRDVEILRQAALRVAGAALIFVDDVAWGESIRFINDRVTPRRLVMIAAEFQAEVLRARKKHPEGMAYAAEGYSIIREEFDELWAEIMRDAPQKKLAAEAIQLGAMGLSFAVEICEP